MLEYAFGLGLLGMAAGFLLGVDAASGIGGITVLGALAIEHGLRLRERVR